MHWERQASNPTARPAIHGVHTNHMQRQAADRVEGFDGRQRGFSGLTGDWQRSVV